MEIAAVRNRRYEVLDSLRGICACMVVLFHFDAYSHAFDWGIVRNGSLFVDFFFVLSGFVISVGYSERLRSGYKISKFMFLRMGRIYPLHIFVLLVFVVFELVFANLVAQYSPSGREAFSGANSFDRLFANFLLVHSMFIYDTESWNGPSWSISVEFYTYAVFAIIAALFCYRKFVGLLLFLVISLAFAFFYLDWLTLGAAFKWGMLRCLYGFATGVLIHQCIVGSAQLPLGRGSYMVTTFVEIAVVVLVGVFISYSVGTFWHNLAPFVFALVIVVFSNEGGGVSRFLRLRPFVFIGMLSFSIYMVHYFILLRLFNGASLFEKLFDLPVFTYISYEGYANGQEVKLLGTELWHGDLLFVSILCVVILISYFSYKWIEQPGIKVSRRWADTIWAANSNRDKN